MKISTNGLNKFIIFILILLEYHLFYIVHLSNNLEYICRMDNIVFVAAIIGIVMVPITMSVYKKYFYFYKNIFIRYFILLISIYLVQFLYTIVRYGNQSLITSLKYCSNFLIIVYVPTLMVMFYKDKTYEKTFDFLNIIALLWNSLIIIAAVIFSLSGKYILDFSNYFGLGIRDYGLRVGIGPLSAYVLLYNISILYYKRYSDLKRKIFSFICVVLSIVALIYVAQTRSLVIYVALAFLAQIWTRNKSKFDKLKLLLILLLVIVLLYFNGFFDIFYNYFFNMLGSQNSYEARISEIGYYLNCFAKNPLFGNSFVSSSLSQYYQIEHGLSGNYHYSDIGVFGLLGQTGLCSIVYYFIPLFFTFHLFLKYKKLLKRELDYGFMIGSLVYLFASSFTLIITDYQRVFLFPIVISFLLYKIQIVSQNK